MLRCFFCLFLLLPAWLGAQSGSIAWYPYEGRFLDLERMEWFSPSNLPDINFKTSGPFRHRFKGLSVDKLYYRGALFEILPKQGLSCLPWEAARALTLDNPEEKLEGGGQNFLFAVSKGLVYVKHLSGLNGFVVYRYNDLGQVDFRVQISHTESVKRERLEYFRPFARYFAHTEQHLLFGSYDTAAPHSVLLDLQTGDTTQFPHALRALVRSEDEQSIVGALCMEADGGLGLRWLPSQAERGGKLHLPASDNRSNRSHETLLSGDTLFVMSYDADGSGAQVRAYYLPNGGMLWKAQIEPLPTAQVGSGYYHTAWLSSFGSVLLCEGYERQRRYLSVLDRRTGRFVRQE